MFWKRILSNRTEHYRKSIFAQIGHTRSTYFRNYSALSTNGSNFTHKSYLLLNNFIPNSPLLRATYCKGLIDGDITQLQQNQQEKELQRITELFPLPRVTLNELLSKTPDRIFEVHYKQNVSTPKGSRKKQKPQLNDWTCTYAFVWPEKIKFESKALSKRLAADKAAYQALHYLYINKRIDSKGNPIYDRDKIAELRSTIQEPINIKISENSIERIEKIWEDYESSIKDVYEATFKNAARRNSTPLAALTKDSTIDEDDDFSDAESSISDNEDILELKAHIHPVYGKTVNPPSQATLERRDRILRQKFEKYDEELTPLPIDQYASEITSTLEKSRVAVIVGAAGCGKSTRVGAAVLRRGRARVAAVIAQPRRVAAIGLAERVAGEIGEQVGDTVGYQVRLHAKLPRQPAGSLLYCTSGILLRRLQANPGLQGCTHVFIDEAHERDVNTDVTLLLLKRALTINPELRIVIMSATLDTEVFTRYFDNCPIIEVPGRTYPVEVSYLDEIQKKFNIRLPFTKENCQKVDGKPQINCQEMVEVIKAADRTQPEGAVLVFLPGWAEIRQAKQLLDAQYTPSTHMILPVHSRLSTTDQIKMFSKPPPGIRKIVLATNIAETSITIPDVVYVIDSGAHKENRIKEGTGTASLETVWVSLAGAKQRAGRAGRVQPGHCYRLYTREKESDFQPHTTPEILRIPLEQTVLDCKSYAPEEKVENFLSQLPEPPTDKAIQLAVNDLMDLGALTPSEKLTRLGSLLSSLSLPPRLGCALLHAACAGAAVSAANVLTHCADNVELFRNAADRREEIRELKRSYNETSDHAALHWIQEEFERAVDEQGWRGADEWCERHGLRKDRLGYVKSLSSLHLEQLLKSGAIESTIEPDELNRFSDIDELTSAILLSGSNAILRTKRHVRTKGKLMAVNGLFTSTGDRAHVGSESVNYNIIKRSQNAILTYFGGYHSTERRALVVHKTSVIPPHTALLFSMGNVYKEIQTDGGHDTAILKLPRHRLQVHIPSSQADVILKTREMLWNTFQYYIERDLKTLAYDENTTISRFKIRLFKAIGRILVEGHREHVLGKRVEDIVDR